MSSGGRCSTQWTRQPPRRKLIGPRSATVVPAWLLMALLWIATGYDGVLRTELIVALFSREFVRQRFHSRCASCGTMRYRIPESQIHQHVLGGMLQEVLRTKLSWRGQGYLPKPKRASPPGAGS